ncbi:hypothetical protein [Vibrio diazotrophicus]|uniref:hypothetical protein n=1 Tax=Vibrio diazotrophicus TaxID=685 RepID=UPI000C9E8077|nr:hypothetical protein [Vibrio diazotrophicus]MCZ4370615.1 hypothetical protein [Vibrio diazotrophicus]PNH91968.1 hypothetical protein C1M59_11540 [Vibrio diazotrophicus]
MKVECPRCHTDNKIEYAENILCKECDKSFKGYKFSKRKLVSSSAALLVGVVGGYQVNDVFDEIRYPLQVEYALVDTCLNASTSAVSKSWFNSKRDICLCAVEKTTKDVSYSDYKTDESLFIRRLKRNAERCS